MAVKNRAEGNNNDSDLRLIEEYLNTGDLGILGTVYSKYMQLVYGLCLKYFRNREEAQDAVISIFEKIIVELDRHRVENFKSWLYVLSKNYCLMKLRSDKSDKRKKEIMMHDSSYFMESAPELHPIDRDNGVSDKALEDCINSLKEEQKLCIRLFYFENNCYRVIADILKIDEKKVKSHLQNAKRNLKLCLEAVNK